MEDGATVRRQEDDMADEPQAAVVIDENYATDEEIAAREEGIDLIEDYDRYNDR